jgi:hypothetical protein
MGEEIADEDRLQDDDQSGGKRRGRGHDGKA